MNVFVYADESGVLDPKHNDYFVFGGLIFLGKDRRDTAARKYRNVESVLRKSCKMSANRGELKACNLTNKQKGDIFRSLNGEYKFGVVVEQERLHESISSNKKSKQRYLDYAFKIGLKRALQGMMGDEIFIEKDVENIYVFMDEHTTATDGRYELKEGLLEEFKYGTINYANNTAFPPILPSMCSLDFYMRDSAQDPLIRASDIVANKLYHCSCEQDYTSVKHKIRFVVQP